MLTGNIIFETKHANLPKDIYFVPSPMNGTMSYDLYYQHLNIHHTHVSNLHSFAITNVGNLKAQIGITNADGSNSRMMTFEEALLNQPKLGSATKLFYLIEPMKTSEMEGRYLMVMDKEMIVQ